MTTATLDPPAATAAPPAPSSDFARRLRQETAAVRLVHSKFGVKRALSREQIAHAADAFNAAGDFVSAAKKLINTRSEHYKAATGVISRARHYWRNMTVPYPIPGIRLIRKDLVDEFNRAMRGFKAELDSSVSRLQTHYVGLVAEARTQLGELFRQSDYPADIKSEFSLLWEYPSVDPPDYLKTLNPALYEEQQARVAARFEDALKMAEEAFTAELHELIAHMVDRLSGTEDGKPKIFRDTSLENLRDFVGKFRTMNVGSNAQLEALVEKAESIIAGVDPDDVRKDKGLRAYLAEQMGVVKGSLDTMIVEKPTRQIVLPDEEETTEEAAA